MWSFLRRHWIIAVPAAALVAALYIMLVRRYPPLAGIVNAETAIAYWLRNGYTKLEAFRMACVFGNVECLCWYFGIGALVVKRRQQLASRIAEETHVAKQAGIGFHLREIWIHFEKRIEPEQQKERWAYRAMSAVWRNPVLRFFARLPLYMVVIAICAVPTGMFTVIAFAHATGIGRKLLVPILIGNTLKMAFAAYGFWPFIFSVLATVRQALFG